MQNMYFISIHLVHFYHNGTQFNKNIKGIFIDKNAGR